MTRHRFADIDSRHVAAALSARSLSAPALSPRTVIVGIPSNIETWPSNRSYVSITRIGGENQDSNRVLQLSHHSEVTVVTVTDRHMIPKALGWSEPGMLDGLYMPSWHKVLGQGKSDLEDALDDVMVTYAHNTEMSEHFYFLNSERAFGDYDRYCFQFEPENLHMLSKSAEAKLPNAKELFTDPDRKDWLGISGDDWDDEIGYNPRFAVLTNHRGSPIALFSLEMRDSGSPKGLQLWNGSQFTTKSELAKLVCRPATLRRKNFEIVSTKLVEKIWPGALKESNR